MTNKDKKQRSATLYFAFIQYYKAAGYSEEELVKRLQDSSKHRHLNAESGIARSSTPEGFWDVDVFVTPSEKAPSTRETRLSSEKKMRGRRR